MPSVFMVFVMFFFVVFLSWLVFVSTNILLWWSVFVFMDLVFVFLCKSVCSFSSVVNYFVFQECLGFLFLFFSYSGIIMSVVVMMKMGLLPFHYWLFVVVDGLKDWIYVWFLTVHKLPYVVILIWVFVFELFYLIVFSFVFCYSQLMAVIDYKMMMMLGSIESFNWVLLSYCVSFFDVVVLMYYYIFLSFCVLPFFGDEKGILYNWLLVFFYINIPFGLSFFVKIFVISSVVVSISLWLVGVMFMMGFFFVCMMVWLVRKSMEVGIFVGEDVNFFYLVFFFLFFLLV